MIPAELMPLRQWVAWRYETRQRTDGESVRTKVPVVPGFNRRASTTDPTTWGTYDAALSDLARDADGVGFVFSPEDPYVGVDMDACINRRGLLHSSANQVVRALRGYYEVSPSGYGLHIIVRGSIERGRHTLKTPWCNELAVYDRGRFFTMEGNGHGEITDAQPALNALIAHYFPEPEQTPSVRPRVPVSDTDTDILDRIHQDARIAALWAGDVSSYGDDHSAADLALCAHLAFFTGNDFARIDSLFRSSGLMRDKWDLPRGDSTYGRITIERAMRGA